MKQISKLGAESPADGVRRKACGRLVGSITDQLCGAYISSLI
jgi:hypothetical protein